MLARAHAARATALALWVAQELARARAWAGKAAKDTEDGEHALEMTYESGTLMNCYARQAWQPRESYERYVRCECPKAG